MEECCGECRTLSLKDSNVNPDEETVEQVRICIESLVPELSSCWEMISQRNTNLNGVRIFFLFEKNSAFRLRFAERYFECINELQDTWRNVKAVFLKRVIIPKRNM